MIYKKQLKKAFSRGLRGKTNNVPGFMGQIFHRVGWLVSEGVELDYVKVEDCSQWSSLKLQLLKAWPSESKISVIHDNKAYSADLDVFFYDFASVKEDIK